MNSKAIAYILIAVFSFSLMNICAKSLSYFHAMQVVFFRAMGTYIFIFPYMLYKRVALLGKHRKFLVMRAILGTASLALFFMAIQRMPLGSAISIRYIGPIMGAVIAMFWLKEKISLGQWMSFIIAFSGVLIIKGFDIRIDLLGFLMILCSACFLGGVFALIRYLSTREHVLTIIHYFMVSSLLLSMAYFSEWRWPLSHEWFPVLSIGVFGLIGQVFMTKSFSLEHASALAPFKYMELVFAMILGYYLFGERHTFWPLIGMLLIVLGMLANIVFKNGPTRKRGVS